MRRLKKQLWPERVTLPSPETADRVIDIEAWLESRIGKNVVSWTVVHRYGLADYYFRNQADATVFALKWSQ
jgi:hypothetical protein